MTSLGILGGIVGLSAILSLLSIGLSIYTYLRGEQSYSDWEKWSSRERQSIKMQSEELYADRIKVFDERLNEASGMVSRAEGLLGRARRDIKKAGLPIDEAVMGTSGQPASPPPPAQNVVLPPPPPLPIQEEVSQPQPANPWRQGNGRG